MHLDHERRTYSGAPDEMVCTCLKVCRQRILEVIKDESIRTVAELRRACRAGGGCGSCHEELARLLLSRRLTGLDFDNAFSQSEHEPIPAKLLASEVELFVRERLNPLMLAFGCSVEIDELDEEVVLNIPSLEQEMKYTIGFLIEAEFAARFKGRLNLIIC